MGDYTSYVQAPDSASPLNLKGEKKEKKKDDPPKAAPKEEAAPKESVHSAAEPDHYKRGGKVRKTGMALVHKGERVLTRKQQRRYRSK